MQQQQIDAETWNIAERLYKAVWKNYTMQISCMTRDDYVRLQTIIGYPETFDQHMTRLIEGIPNDPRVMVTQMACFLAKYIEFKDPKYIEKLETVTEYVENNRETHKMKALEILIDQNKDMDHSSYKFENDHHSPLFEVMLGDTKLTLPTFGNPMMTAFYSFCFMSFAMFQQTELPPEAEGQEYYL